MRYKHVCNDLLVERWFDFKKLIKAMVVLLFVVSVVFLVLRDSPIIPAHVEEESSTDDGGYYLPDDGDGDENTDNTDLTDDSLNYARNRLNSSEQKLYDKFYEMFSRGEYKMTSGLSGYTAEEVEKVFNSVYADHPEFCWLRQGFTMSSDLFTGYVNRFEVMICCDESDIKSVQAQAVRAAQDIINRAMTYESEYEKALFVHDYLVDKIEYNNEYADLRGSNEPKEVSLGCSMYGALVDGSTVCQGYAQAYQYILKELGIEAVYATGYGNGGAHAWTLLKLEGDYYYTDLTWNDPTYSEGTETNGIKHEYFCITTAELERDHTLDDAIEYEECTATDCSYFTRSGYYVESYSRDQIKQIVSNMISNDDHIEIKFANQEVFEQATEDLIDNNGMYELLGELNIQDRRFSRSAEYPYIVIYKDF